jgi:hypothetical protein
MFKRFFPIVTKSQIKNSRMDFIPEDYYHSIRIYINRENIDRSEYNFLSDFIQSLPKSKDEYLTLDVKLERKFPDKYLLNNYSIELKKREDILKFLDYSKKDIIDPEK